MPGGLFRNKINAVIYKSIYRIGGREEPRLFRFLFMRPRAFSQLRQALLPMIERSVAALMETYRIGHEEADLLHDQLWMHAHAIAAMIATDFCDWDMAKVERMLDGCRHAFTQQYEV